jgi:hypothetical protein
VSSSAEIVTRALKRLALIEPGETPAEDMAEDGLAALNAMLAGWEADGINVSPDVPLPAKHEEGVVAMLAVRLAPDYGKEAAAQVYADASKGLSRLEADYISAPLASFDHAIVNTPGRMTIATATVDDWANSTAYLEFDRVEANRKVYECIVPGTSSSTGDGPHSSGAAITDGSVTWRFIGFAN